MRKINFLINLKENNKLKIVEPSDEIKEAFIKKSNNSLKSAKMLLDNNQLEDSVSLTYYSMYNMLTALLFKVGIKCENHSASIIILKELFKLDDSKISFVKTERIDKQYYIDFKITKKDVKSVIKIAEEFNPMIYEFIDKLTSKRALNYRTELTKSLGFKQ